MWYVIWTTTGREDRCLDFLKRYEDLYDRAFVPKRTLRRKYKQIWRKVELALFPGYLFVETDYERLRKISYELIFNNTSFNIVLATDGDFLPLTEQEEAFIDSVYKKSGNFDFSVGMIEGDKIKITSGPLMGMEGSISKINRHKRTAYLDLTMFGKKTKIEVGLEIIQKNVLQ